MGNKGQVGYPNDVPDEECGLGGAISGAAPGGGRAAGVLPSRGVQNGLRYIVRTGGQWRYMPNDLPPWPYERLATTLGAFHFLAFACHMIANLFRLLA
jgi:transposase